jgi:hypothetical protein
MRTLTDPFNYSTSCRKAQLSVQRCTTYILQQAHLFNNKALHNLSILYVICAQVGWPEINAGLGQAAIALMMVAAAMKIRFTR